jgi:hypothetical protein
MPIGLQAVQSNAVAPTLLSALRSYLLATQTVRNPATCEGADEQPKRALSDVVGDTTLSRTTTLTIGACYEISANSRRTVSGIQYRH